MTDAKWMTSGAQRLKANLGRSFGVRKIRKDGRNRKESERTSLSSCVVGVIAHRPKNQMTRRASKSWKAQQHIELSGLGTVPEIQEFPGLVPSCLQQTVHHVHLVSCLRLGTLLRFLLGDEWTSTIKTNGIEYLPCRLIIKLDPGVTSLDVFFGVLERMYLS
eukprot:CCRYP_012837-RB/>CCRYP_012837-RB protein AED:0.42 eAED:0.42 QI:969/0.33/0.5/1/0.33/0.25/4/0/161